MKTGSLGLDGAAAVLKRMLGVEPAQSGSWVLVPCQATFRVSPIDTCKLSRLAVEPLDNRQSRAVCTASEDKLPKRRG